MLVTNNIGEVVSIKLVSGEEIIGKLEKSDDQDVMLHKPLLLLMTKDGPAFHPYMVTTDIMKENPKISFAKHTIVATAIPLSDFSEAYIAATEPSKIEQIKKPGLILPH